MIDEANAVVVVLVVGSVAFLLSLAAVPTVRRVALRTGVLDGRSGQDAHRCDAVPGRPRHRPGRAA